MDKTIKILKKHWIAVWLVLAVIGIGTSMVLAEYIAEKNRIQRVAANVAVSGQPFDSNYMVVGAPSFNNIPFASGTETWCPVEVKIWNYNRANPQKTYRGALSYTLTAQLVDSAGNVLDDRLGSYQIGIKADNEENYTYFDPQDYDATDGYFVSVENSRSFPSNYNMTEHKYTLRFPVSFLTDNPGIYIKLVATPSDMDRLSPISGIFGVTMQETTLPKGWNGVFNDDESQKNYDGFNYLITGSGKERITFSWDPVYLDVNAYNLADYGLTVTPDDDPGRTGWSMVQFDVDSNDRYRYDFQLYMTSALEAQLNAVMETPSTDEIDYWNEVKQHVFFGHTDNG